MSKAPPADVLDLRLGAICLGGSQEATVALTESWPPTSGPGTVPRRVRSLPFPRVVRRAALYTSVAALLAAVTTQFLPATYRAVVKILPSDSGPGLPLTDLLAGSDFSA